MIDFLNNYILTPYVQALLFFILIGVFFLQHRRFALLSTGLTWLRTIILLMLFLYFAWNWASEIPSSLRAASVLGMFFINLHMLYNLLLGGLEEKYRQALAAFGQEAHNQARLEQVWNTGKKYLRTRYLFDALLSGSSPGSFLQGLTSRRIPLDVQREMAKHGVDQEVITTAKLLAFLTEKLAQAQELPLELKDILAQAMQQFGEHAWIQEQVNEFLRLALTDPEKLYRQGRPAAPPEKP